MECVVQFADVLAAAHEEMTFRVQRMIEDREDVILHLRLQIDEQVAADNEILLGKGRVAQEVVGGKDHHLAQAVVDLVAVLAPAEEAAQAGRRDIGHHAVEIVALTGTLQRLAVDVGGKDLDFALETVLIHVLAAEHGQRVCFLARRAARRPDAHDALFGAEDDGKDLFDQQIECVEVTEKARDANQQFAIENRLFLFRLGKELHVLLERGHAVDADATLEPAQNRVLLVVREVDPAVLAHDQHDLGERVEILAEGHFEFLFTADEWVLQVVEQFLGHLRRRQHIVDKAGGNRTARHAVKLGAHIVLHHDHAAGFFDGACPERAVAARAGKDDADGMPPFFGGQ